MNLGVGSKVSVETQKIMCLCGKPRFWNSTVYKTVRELYVAVIRGTKAIDEKD
jgi:hypothetical protein